jgi:D-alanine-D-alanine ligase
VKIGLTYDLRSDYLAAGYGEVETAEFDRDDTIDALEKTLTGLGHQTERIGNARSHVQQLAAGRCWDLVFNIAEGMNGIGREAQVPAILDVFGIAYTFSDPLVMALTLHKGMTKHVLRDAGVATTDFMVVSEPNDLRAISFGPPYFIKPVA